MIQDEFNSWFLLEKEAKKRNESTFNFNMNKVVEAIDSIQNKILE